MRLTELRGGTNRSSSLRASGPSGSKTDPLTSNEKNTIYINESGLCSLILCSKLESARVFKRLVTKDVLPSIRKTARYIYDDMIHKYSDSLTFKIENETDLHTKVVSFSKGRYLYSIFTATLGENQDTSKKRIESQTKGYFCGSLDLIINNLHKHYTGFAIEFKNLNGNGVLSYDQSKMLWQYQNNGFKSQLQCFHKLISNDRIWPSEHGFEVILEKSLFVFEISAFKVRNKRGIHSRFHSFSENNNRETFVCDVTSDQSSMFSTERNDLRDCKASGNCYV